MRLNIGLLYSADKINIFAMPVSIHSLTNVDNKKKTLYAKLHVFIFVEAYYFSIFNICTQINQENIVANVNAALFRLLTIKICIIERQYVIN